MSYNLPNVNYSTCIVACLWYGEIKFQADESVFPVANLDYSNNNVNVMYWELNV